MTSPIQNNAATGFVVTSVPGGGSDDGKVAWTSQGRNQLSQAGFAAIFSQISTYVAARSTIRSSMQVQVNANAGFYNCLNGDLAAQHAAIVAIFANGANVSASLS